VLAVSLRIGCGLSTLLDVRDGAVAASSAAREQLDGAQADLAVVFASGTHLSAPETLLEGIHETLAPGQLIGCGASGVVAQSREIESDTAVAVWAANLDGGGATTFTAVFEIDGDEATFDGLPSLGGATGLIVLPDPYSFATDVLLAELATSGHPGPVLGGLSSARTADGTAALFCGDQVVEEGAVGARLDGVEVLPCVSQGATPVGPELTVTAAEGHVIHELAGKPALTKLREVFEVLSEREQRLIGGGLLVGLVMAIGKPDYEQGDFLVRGVMGADSDTGSVTIGADVEVGQILRLHARDATSADRDLRQALALRRAVLGDRGAAGALLFTCNGRGRGMFGVADHDAQALSAALDGAPVAGFFAAGEIGPVGAGTFLHGFTATAGLFPA
jgi:small ligand-binding sensory domain FIST